MATISIAEEIVNTYSTEEVLSLLQGELTMIKQATTSKEQDKAFLLGKVSTMSTFSVSLVDALRKKIAPNSKEEPPVVAG